jgi:hypothetical protein
MHDIVIHLFTEVMQILKHASEVQGLLGET